MSSVPSYSSGQAYQPYASVMQDFSGDQTAALYGTGSAQQNLMNMGAQQQTLTGDGGSGYTMQGGNDTTGSSWGNTQAASNPMNPWSSMSQAPQQIMGTIGAGAPASTAAPSTGPGTTPMTGSASVATGGYPAYPNSYGIGIPSASGPAANAVPSNGAENANAVSSMAPQATTTGFNPWSLQGEANSRIM